MMSRKPAIVVVTERQLFPVTEGTRARIVTLIRSLKRLGFRVVLITAADGGTRNALRTRWIVDAMYRVHARGFQGGSPAAYSCAPFEPAVANAVRRYQPVAVIAEYVWMAPCLRFVHGGAVRLIDTIDLMHARRRFAGHIDDAWVACTADEERALLDNADAIIAIQPQERDAFRALVPGTPVICVPHHLQTARGARIFHSASARAPVVAMVGSANPSNVQGIRSFLDIAWPIVTEAVPGARLKIHGQLASAVARTPCVEPVGPARNLARVYRDAAVIINPVALGTGLKIKTVEALAYGKALVTTSCGAEGLARTTPAGFVIADEMRTFGQAVASLLADPRARARQERAAARFAAVHFALDRVYGELLLLLSPAGRGASRSAAAVQAAS